MLKELYKAYRPAKLSEVVGQPEVVTMLESMLRNKTVPRTVLFTGPSGCGKTTLARIMCTELAIDSDNFEEINCAAERGIDEVRSLQNRMRYSPLGSKYRAFILDECHNLTKDAQTALLKTLEDTPKTVFFFLCTTDPKKLLPTIITRCSEMSVKSLCGDDARGLIEDILVKEKVPQLSTNVVDAILEACEGSPRKILVKLQEVLELNDDKQRLEHLKLTDGLKKTAQDLMKALCFDGRPDWSTVSGIIRNMEDQQNWESIRHLILAVATTMLLKQSKSGPNADRLYLILNAFHDNWYDSGRAGLVRSSYEVVTRSGK